MLPEDHPLFKNQHIYYHSFKYAPIQIPIPEKNRDIKIYNYRLEYQDWLETQP